MAVDLVQALRDPRYVKTVVAGLKKVKQSLYSAPLSDAEIDDLIHSLEANSLEARTETTT